MSPQCNATLPIEDLTNRHCSKSRQGDTCDGDVGHLRSQQPFDTVADNPDCAQTEPDERQVSKTISHGLNAGLYHTDCWNENNYKPQPAHKERRPPSHP